MPSARARLRRRAVGMFSEDTLRRLQRARHGEPTNLGRHPTQIAPRGTVAHVVDSYDAAAVHAATAADLMQLLDTEKIAYVAVPGPRGSVRQLGVGEGDRITVLEVLDELARTEPGWRLTPAAGKRQQAKTVSVERVLAAPDGTVLRGATGVTVGFWTPVERDDAPRTDGAAHTRGTMLAPDANGIADYLSADTWRAAISSGAHWPPSDPDVFAVREPIDVVYTWVDGTDPAWLERRATHDPDAAHHASAGHDARYLSRDELRYSLRSLAMYANWVRHVWVVTDAQVPDWLRTDHPRLTVVDHRDIFTDPGVLPVFNSHAIESQLHHIDGLAEHYLYLNDDMLFGRPVEPEVFFHANGIANFFLGKGTIDLDPASARDLPVLSAAKHQRELMAQDFGVTVTRRFKHVAHPQHRSVLAELEAAHPQLFARVAASRFRHPDDVSIPSSLVHYWSYARGRAVPADIHYRYQDIARTDTPRRLEEILRERPQMFCVNDVQTGGELSAEHAEAIGRFFAAYFPLPSPFER